MCICLVAINYHPDYPLILLSNRDESFDRPTLYAHFWNDQTQILAGRDLKDKGTWLGVSKQGRIALLTNYRSPDSNDPNKKSRGALVVDFLKNPIAPHNYIEVLKNTKTLYNGYNLIFGEIRDLYYYNNFFDIWSKLNEKINVLSNGTLNNNWPKCKRLKDLFLKNVSNKKININVLFKILIDTKSFPDHELPDTGIGILKERFLSPIFIIGKDYGTRTSTVILFNNKGNIQFIERTYKPGTTEIETEKYYFFDIKSFAGFNS